MKPLSRQILASARAQDGIVTAEQLKLGGIVGRERCTALDSGLLVPVHRGIYALGGQSISFRQRCQAALLAAPGSALSGPTAGRFWSLRKVRTDEVHLIARRGFNLDGVAAHRTDLLGPGDIVQQDGCAVLRPSRLLCDLAWHLGEAELESVYEQMLDRGLVSVALARAAARRFVAPGRPGSVRLVRVLDARAAWLRPVDSDYELVLFRALAERGLRLDRQVRIVLDTGVAIHVDLGDPLSRFGIEVDHVTYHGGRLDVQADKRRDREVARLGWTISRVTDDDINNRLMETVDQLIDIASVVGART